MTIGEFVEETSKLEKYFGKELDEFQRKIWYEEIENLSLQRYRQIIRQVFKTSKFMPKLADIIEINSTLAHENNNVIREKVDCSKCNGEGFVLYTKMFNNGVNQIPYQYVAKCDCANGDQFSYNGLTIKDSEHRSKYYIPSVAELGF